MFVLFSCKEQAQTKVQDSRESFIRDIYGEWKYEKHLWHQYGRYTEKEHLDFFKKGVLRIEKNRIYLKNVPFIDTCFYSKKDINISTGFEKGLQGFSLDEIYRGGEKPMLTEKDIGILPFYFTKKGLIKLRFLEIKGCYDRSPSLFYFEKDTLIINSLKGITIFMTKNKRNNL